MDRKRIVFLFFVFLGLKTVAQPTEYRKSFIAMGSAFEVVVVAGADSASWANAILIDAQAHIQTIEHLISSWIPESQTSMVNDNAGLRQVAVSQDLLELVARSITISKLTDGAFDISYASMADVWQFDEANRTTWPDSSLVAQKRHLVNYQNIYINKMDGTIYLEKTGMRIGFGAIGKGFAADHTAKYLRLQGVKSGVVNASGDLFCWGTDADGAPWRVAVANPTDKNEVLLWLQATNQAVVTSGDYEKYKLHNGIRYAHIINPKTGYPVTGVMSATVIAPTAELADALATAIFVLGREAGIKLINQLDGISCIVIDSENKMHTSANIDIATE
jgi:thiamine biosynthesis lipoprotein